MGSISRNLAVMKHRRRRSVMDLLLTGSISALERLNQVFVESNSRTISKLYLRSKKLEKSAMGREYNFVTFNELVAWTNEWADSFASDYDLIVGIPRSGLLVASIIATKLGKPFTTTELFAENRFWLSKRTENKREFQNILLVDDTVGSGQTMQRNLKLLRSHHIDLRITRAAVIAGTRKDPIDLYYKIVPYPRICEWNLLDSKKGKLGSDMDGVICENCPSGVDSDEEAYSTWIRNAKPYLIPTFEIDMIVSNRLEKYRSDTEEWLAKYGVCYKELVLWDLKSKRERKGRNAQHKIDVFLKKKPDMIWESSFYEAQQIWKNTQIPTLCIDERILLS